MLESLCAPALIYIVFSLVQIIIDTSRGLYNVAFMKFWVAIIFTILLNFLCSIGLTVISWMIVFIPFILMTFIISLLILAFGLNPSTGKVNYNPDIYNVQNTYQESPLPDRDIISGSVNNDTNTTNTTNTINTNNTINPSGGLYFDNMNDANVNTIQESNNN